MESRESQRNKRIQEVLKGNGSPGANVLRAREELQGIDAERARNLDQQKAFLTGRQQQMNTMRQAAMIGASGLAAGTGGGAVLQNQVAAMNPQTQAMLQKYGVKPGQKQTTSSKTSQTTQQGQGVKVTNNNTTNNNTRNEIRIVQPQIPMRQQSIPMKSGGSGGDLNKFKAWLNSAFAKQDNQYEIQQKEFRKREWNLARTSSKLFQKLSESTASLGQKMDPKSLGSTIGSQFKLAIGLFLMTTIDKWWKPLMKTISNVEIGIRSVFGLPLQGDLAKNGATQEYSFVNRLKAFIGIDTKTAKGRNINLIEGISNVFKDGINRLVDTLKLFVEDRRIAFQKIQTPDFKLPKTDNSLGGMISGAIGSVMKGIMAPVTGYLGDIFSVMMGGSKALRTKSAWNVSQQAKDNFKRDFGGKYFTSNSTDLFGNLKDDSTYGMSQLMLSNMRDGSNTLHTGGLMTGMKMLEGNAKKSGGAVINPELLTSLGYSQSTIQQLINSGQAQTVTYSLIRVPKSDAEKSEYAGGNLTSYIAGGAVSGATGGLIGNAGTRLGAKTAKAAGKSLFRLGAKTMGATLRAGGMIARGLSPWVTAGMTAAGAVNGALDYAEASKGMSGYVLKAVPMSDPRAAGGEPVQMLRLTPEGFNTLKQAAHVKEFDATDPSFQRWIEGRERSIKVAMGVKGKFGYQNSAMKGLNTANQLYANYQSKMDKTWHDENLYGKAGLGTLVATRDNTMTAMSRGFSWAAAGLRDINFKLTGHITPGRIPSGQARENAIRGMRYLMEKYGLSKEAASGIAGVIQEESGWNPGAQNQQEKAKGYRGFGRGLCQWSNDWGTKYFPEWYQRNFGERKYPDEVPLEHQLDYLMSGEGEGCVKKEFLSIITKPGVTVQEAARAMYLGYENGSSHLASFSALSKVKAYGGASGVANAYYKRTSSALSMYGLSGGDLKSADGTGFAGAATGSYHFGEDAVEGQNGWSNATWILNNPGKSLSFNGGLKLADIQDIKDSIAGSKVDDSLKLGDWLVGRSINYLRSNVHTTKSTGYCAKSVRMALEAGEINMKGHPAAASDYIEFLPTRGFARISPDSKLQPGDIAVLPAGGTHVYGHICMYTGSVWISDFIQNGPNVYGPGWPIILFRYTGKGGSGTSESIVSTIKEGALDAMGKVMDYVAQNFENTAESLKPGTYNASFDTSGLSASQMATYKWAMGQGAKSDDTGVYLEKSGYRHYVDLNSGFSVNGMLSSNNFQGSYKVGENGTLTALSTSEESITKNALLADLASIHTKKVSNGKSIVLDYEIPRAFTDMEGFSERVKHYLLRYKKLGGIRFNLYELSHDGVAYDTVLVPPIPLLTEYGTAPYISDKNKTKSDHSAYPVEFEHTGFRGKNSWAVLYSRKKEIKSDLKTGRVESYEYSPYLHGDLKVSVTPEAAEIIGIIMQMIRGELSASETGDLTDPVNGILKGFDLKKISGFAESVRKGNNDTIKTALGLNEESIKASMENYQKGLYAGNYTEDSKGFIRDKTLGVVIGRKGSDGKFVGLDDAGIKEVLNPKHGTLKDSITENLAISDAISGKYVGNAELDYERYKNLYGRNIFDKSDKFSRGRLAKDLFGDTSKNGGKPILTPTGRQWDSNYGKVAEFILNENGKLRKTYKLLNESESARRVAKNAGISWEDIRNNGVSYEDIKVFGLKTSSRDRELGTEIDVSSKEALQRTTQMKVGDINSAIDRRTLLTGLETDFNTNKITQERIASNIKKYNSGEISGWTDDNGNVFVDIGGRREAIGKAGKDGKVVAFKGGTGYAEANEKVSGPSLTEKINWYANKFGAVSMGGGRMYIDTEQGRFKFNVTDIGNNLSMEELLKSSKAHGQYYIKSDGGSTDIFSDSKDKWIEGTNYSVNKAYFNKKLIERADTLSKRSDAQMKKDYERTYKANASARGADLVRDPKTRDTTAATNAHLESLEEINKDQADFLKIIAENTAKDEDTKTEIGKIAGRGNTTLSNKVSDANRNEAQAALVRHLQASGRKGWTGQGGFTAAMAGAAKELGISVDELAARTGTSTLGNWSKGIMGKAYYAYKNGDGMMKATSVKSKDAEKEKNTIDKASKNATEHADILKTQKANAEKEKEQLNQREKDEKDRKSKEDKAYEAALRAMYNPSGQAATIQVNQTANYYGGSLVNGSSPISFPVNK